jgi:putative spermidine/putrescine transport system permease protein
VTSASPSSPCISRRIEKQNGESIHGAKGNHPGRRIGRRFDRPRHERICGRAPPDSHRRRAGLAAARFAGLVFGVIEEIWKRNMRGLRGGVLLSVYAWTVIAALLVPIVAFVPVAFTVSTFLSLPPQNFSLRWFEEFAASPLWLGAMIQSFGIGFATAAITVVIGSLAALGVARTCSRLGGAAFLLFRPR